MTNPLVERLRTLLATTSPRPWQIVPYGDGDSLVIHDCRADWRVCFMATPGETPGAPERIEDNAELIVEAINALPQLLEERATLESQVAALREALEEANSALQQFRGIQRGNGWDDQLDQLDEAQATISTALNRRNP